MTQHRHSPKLLLYTVLLFTAAACMVLYAVQGSSTNKSVIRESNLGRVHAASRYLREASRKLEEDKDESGDSDEDADEEESADADADADADNEESADEGADEDGEDEDSDSDEDEDEDEAPESLGEDETTLSTTTPSNGLSPSEGEQAPNPTGVGGMGVSPSSQPGQGGFPSTPPQGGADLGPPATSPFGGGPSPPQDAIPPVDSVSPLGEEPTASNATDSQFGDTPFLGQGSDWATTTPPIGDFDDWITPMEPTDEEPEYVPPLETVGGGNVNQPGFPVDGNGVPTQYGFDNAASSSSSFSSPPAMQPTGEQPGYAPPADNVGGHGGNMNQQGFPPDGNGVATPPNEQYAFDNSASSSFSSPPAQGGGFNTQYGNGSSQQYGSSQFGSGSGQAPKTGGGFAGAWKNMKNKNVEQGKSSLGEEIMEEEAMEEEEEADESEGGSDDDKVTSTPQESGSKPADTDDEFEKMIEEAEGGTSKEKGISKETKEDLDAEEKEEIAEEELEEVEEELKEEEEVAAAAGGMGFLLAIGGMIFTAHQMSENPDGVYASVCRLAITISGVIVKIICMPCRKVIGTGNPNYATHMPVSTSADYGMGGANAGFEMS